MWTHGIDVTRDDAVQQQRLFITTSDYGRKTIEINNRMLNGFVTFIGETKCGKYAKTFFCPTKIRVAKSLKRNPCSLKYRDSMPCLLILLAFIQRSIICMYIPMYTDLRTTTCYFGDHRRMTA